MGFPLVRILVVLAVLLAGCGSPPADLPDSGLPADAGLDAGSGADAGPDGGADVDGGVDAGATTDAGADAGVGTDAGDDAGSPVDAGADAGSGSDAGPSPDAGTDAGTTDAGVPGGCGNPLPLTFAGDVATATGSTAGGPSAVLDGACLSSGPEHLYAFALTSTRSVLIEVTPAGAYRPSVSLRGGSCAGSRIDCAMSPSAGAVTRLSLPQVQAGTWFVAVDGDGAGGGYTLTVTLGPSRPWRGDGCDDPYRTALSGDAVGSQQTGDTLAGLANDAVSDSCDGSGPDRVYRLNLTVPRRVTLSLAANASSPTFRPVIYVQQGTCAPLGNLSCDAASAAGGTASPTFPSLGPGTFYVWLDGHGGTSGGYTFSYSLAVP